MLTKDSNCDVKFVNKITLQTTNDRFLPSPDYIEYNCYQYNNT